MDIKSLFNKLQHYYPKLYTSSSEYTPFTSVKFLANGLTLLEPDILYIGKTSSLKEFLTISHSCNVLCVKDIDVPQKLTENTNINFIILGKNVDLPELFNEVYDILLIEQGSLQSSELLSDTLMKKNNFGGIHHIIEIAYEMLGNPIAISTPDGIMTANKNISTIDTFQLNDQTLIKNSPIFLSSLDSVNSSSTPVLIKDLFNSKYTAIIGKIVIEDLPAAYMVVVEFERPFRKFDIEIVSQICKVLSSELKKCSYPQNLINASFENILFDLLNGSAGNKEIIEERIKSLHLDIKKYFYVLTIKVLDINTKNLSLASIKSLLEKSIPDSRSIMFGGNIVILINTNRYDFSSSRSLKPVTEVMEKYNLFGGLSRCFYNLIDLNHYHKQSLKAIELGMQNNRRKSLHIYDDYLIYHLLDMKSQSVDLKEFCHPKLLELLEYDSRHNTQYTYTLYVLLTVKGKQVDAANILNIHRSTMLYRMEKIEELTGLNVSEPKDIVQLYFSFIILKMTGKLDPELYTEFF
jgi:hypothetical protein